MDMTHFPKLSQKRI